MSLFGPPVIERIEKATVILEGGRTRLTVTLSGWGRLVLTLASADGTGRSIRRFVGGGTSTLFVDILPPCALTFVFRNPFGIDSSSIRVDTVLPGIDPVPLPGLRSFPTVAVGSGVAEIRVPAPKTAVPRADRLTIPAVSLGPITIKKRFSGG